MIFNQTLCRFSGPPSVEQTYTWNFEKFLLGRNGEVVARFQPRTKPNAADVIELIERELATQ